MSTEIIVCLERLSNTKTYVTVLHIDSVKGTPDYRLAKTNKSTQLDRHAIEYAAYNNVVI